MLLYSIHRCFGVGCSRTLWKHHSGKVSPAGPAPPGKALCFPLSARAGRTAQALPEATKLLKHEKFGTSCHRRVQTLETKTR